MAFDLTEIKHHSRRNLILQIVKILLSEIILQ